MARKPVIRELPPLDELLPNFAGFSDSETKMVALAGVLRDVAKQSRTDAPRPFYSVREVATFFRMSVSGVVKAYQILEDEGLLIRKRSAFTELAPLKGYKRVVHRGIVVIPIWMPGFVHYRDRRSFFLSLERELIRYGYVPNMVFYHQEEEIKPDFVHRVLSHKPDYLVWLQPSPSDSTALEMLGDAGVRLIVLSGFIRHQFRGLRYRMELGPALRKAFAHWRNLGIRRVVIPTENGYTRTHVGCEPGRVAHEMGLEVDYAQPGKRTLREHVAAMTRSSHTGVVFDEDLWHFSLCAQVPAEVGTLVRRIRTLALHPLNLAPSHLADSTLDTIKHDWQSIAHQVARKLTGQAVSARGPTVFEARFQEDVPAETYGTHLANL
jgi:hypothetical protein